MREARRRRPMSAWRDLLPAADFMVGRLCAQHPGTPIIFVAGGHSDRYLPLQGHRRARRCSPTAAP